jgi:acetolactate synthase-1/2/3 large subunit
MKNGGQIVADWIEAIGTDCFFNVPGETFLPVLDALRDSRVKVVTCRHESGASFAAAAYARYSGKIGVCMATRGPGGSNLSIGVQTAFYEAVPMVVLIGQVPRRVTDSFAFQEVDMRALYGSIAKQVINVSDSKSLGQVLRQAEVMASTGRRGPVVIAIPQDILFEETTVELPPSPRVWNSSLSITESCADEFLLRIAEAHRPVIVSCIDFNEQYRSAIEEVSLALGLPVINGWRRYSSFRNNHVNFCGSIGLGASSVVQDALLSSDLILAFGEGLEDVTIGGAAGWGDDTTVVVVSPVPDANGIRRTGQSAQVEFIPADPTQFLKSVNARIAQNPSYYREIAHRWSDRRDALCSHFVDSASSLSNMTNDSMTQIFQLLEEAMPLDAVVVSDAGNFAQWLLRLVSFCDRGFLGPVNGAMGYGLPGAIGVKLSGTRHPVWAITGDGGLLMTIGELDTAIRHGLDLVCIVINNSSFGTIRAHQERFYPGRAIGTDIGPVDFGTVAEGLGWTAWSVSSLGDIPIALREVGEATGCRLLEVRVNQVLLSLESVN